MHFNRVSATLVLIFSLFFSTLSIGADALLSLESEIKKRPGNIKARETLARIHIKNKNNKKAIDLLAPYSNEISTTSLIELAKAYEQNNDSLNEIRVLQIYSEKDPNRFRPHYLLGLAYKKNKQYDQAAKSLRQAIDFAPKHRPSYDSLLEIFSLTKQNYESRTLLNDMNRTFGAKKEFSNMMCRLFAIDNFLTEALETCKVAISKNPKYPDNHIYLAQTYYNQDNKPAAERIFRTAGRQFIKSEFVQYAAGEFYLNEKNYPAAIRYLETAVKVNPQTMRAQLTLALALFESRSYEKALEHFINSCKLDKSSETLTSLKNSAAKLRQLNQDNLASMYERKAAVCQQY